MKSNTQIKNLPRSKKFLIEYLIPVFFFAPYAFADFQTSLQSLITGALSGIFPMIAMFQVGVAGLAWARKSPDAKDRAEAAVIGTIAVVGINGVWTYLKGHIR